MTCQQSPYDAYFDSGNKVLSSRNEGSCILITAWLEFLDRHERVNIYQYFILSSIFKTSEFGLVSTCAGQCHQESEGWEPRALLAESVVYPTTHIVPMALMDCAFSSKPYIPISMARKLRQDAPITVRKVAKASTDSSIKESMELIESVGGNVNPRLAGDSRNSAQVYPRVSMEMAISFSDQHVCRSCSSPLGVIPPGVFQSHSVLMKRYSKWPRRRRNPAWKDSFE